MLQACTKRVAAGAAAGLKAGDLPALEWAADAWGGAGNGSGYPAAASPRRLRLDNVRPRTRTRAHPLRRGRCACFVRFRAFATGARQPPARAAGAQARSAEHARAVTKTHMRAAKL